MHLINKIVLSCPKCGTIIKIPLKSALNKVKNDSSYELKCHVCSFNFSEPIQSQSSIDIEDEFGTGKFNRAVILSNNHNAVSEWLENLKTVGFIDYE